MSKLDQIMLKASLDAVKALYGATVEEQQIQLQQTRSEFEGDITLVAFPLLRASKKTPENTAKEIGEYLLKSLDIVQNYNVIKGFLNLEIKNSFWIDFLKSASLEEKFGFEKANSKAPLMVEYSSPNTNKPLHLGHLRNNFLGH